MLAALRLRARRTLPSPWLLAAAAAFALLIVVSAIANGAGAVTSAGKLAELAALTLGAAAFLDTRERLAALAESARRLHASSPSSGARSSSSAAAAAGRASFLGEHDLAALGTLALVVGLARLYSRAAARRGSSLWSRSSPAASASSSARRSRACSASTSAPAALVALALVRAATPRSALSLVTLAVAVVVTAGTLALRSGELGFLQSWFGPSPSGPASTRRAGASA